MMTGLLHTHTLSVVLFLLIYLIKCVLLWTNTARLDAFVQKIRIPEMIVSALFLITGLALAYNNASIGVGSWFWVKLGAVFAAIPVAVVGAVVTDPMDSSGKTNANYDLVAHGKSVFLAQCALCHGEDGKKGLGGAKNLEETRLDKNQIMDLLLKGKNTMPSYRNVLSEQEMMAVVAYVKIRFASKGH